MKKTHSANIGGTIFHIEEDAYERLQDYLQSIHTHFHFFPDVEDIVADIEGRIAELLRREQPPQVLRMSDVERVIEAMGRIEQFDEPQAAQTSSTEARKLFRDPERKIIAGVAAGLASYLGVPVLLVRIAFVLVVCFYATGLVAYLLLWALAPVASSTTDRLQMRGRPLTLATIDKGVRDGIASIPQATRSAATQSVTAVGSLIHLAVVTVARAIRWVAGVLVVGGATLGILLLTVMLVVALVNPDAPPLHLGAAGLFNTFGGWQHAFKACAYLVFAVPLAIIIATGLKLFWGATRLNTRGLAGLLGIWVVAVLAGTGIWSHHYPQFSQYLDELPSVHEANHGLARYSAIVAPTSPLSDAQSKALLASLIAEYKRSRAENNRFYSSAYDDFRTQVANKEKRIQAQEESDRRVLESARAYLDDRQLVLVQESMTRYITQAHANLEAWREQMERGKRYRRRAAG